MLHTIGKCVKVMVKCSPNHARFFFNRIPDVKSVKVGRLIFKILNRQLGRLRINCPTFYIKVYNQYMKQSMDLPVVGHLPSVGETYVFNLVC